MKTKKKILKICSIALVALLVLLSLSSCKKKDNETKAVANPSALVNKDAVVQSDNSSNSIVTVPVPVNVVEDKTSISTEVVASSEKEPEKVEGVSNSFPLNNEVEKVTIEVIPTIEEKPSVPQPPVFASENKATDEIESKEVNTPAASLVDTVNTDTTVNETILEETNTDNGSLILSDRFTIDGLSAEFVVSSDNAIFTFSEPYPSLSFVVSVLDTVVGDYPALSEAVMYKFDGKSLTLSYPKYYFGKDKSEVYNNLFILRDIVLSLINESHVESDLFSREYQLYGKKVYITATSSSAFITSVDAFTSSEINEAIEILKANFPEESKYVYYTLKEDGIELTYPVVDDSYILAALDALDDLILAYTPMPLTESFDDLSGSMNESNASDEIPASKDEKSNELTIVEPLTKAGNVLNDISLGLSMKGELDFSYPSSPFVLGFDVRGEYKINDRFSAGLKLGYDLSGYMPIEGYLKYNFSNPEGLYVFGEAGISIGIGAGRPTGLILGGGLGYEVEVIDNLFIFGEVGVVFRSNAAKGVIPSIALGARYSF